MIRDQDLDAKDKMEEEDEFVENCLLKYFGEAGKEEILEGLRKDLKLRDVCGGSAVFDILKKLETIQNKEVSNEELTKAFILIMKRYGCEELWVKDIISKYPDHDFIDKFRDSIRERKITISKRKPGNPMDWGGATYDAMSIEGGLNCLDVALKDLGYEQPVEKKKGLKILGLFGSGKGKGSKGKGKGEPRGGKGSQDDGALEEEGEGPTQG